MRFKCTPLLGILAILTPFLFAACDSSDPNGEVRNTDFVASAEFSYEIPVTQQGRLRLLGVNGNVQIVARSSATSVSISGERRVGSESRDDAERHLPDLKVDVRDSSTEVVVETNQPSVSGGRNYIVNYEIVVPAGLDALVTNINGNADIRDIGGKTVVGLTNGNVVCYATSGPDGDIELATVNGNIDLGVPSDISASLTATITNGNISVNDLEMSNLVTTPTKTTGMLGEGDLAVTLTTVNGNIEVSGHD